MGKGIGELHLAVCRRFGEAVRSADGKWDRPSPCSQDFLLASAAPLWRSK
jgi:hypothetical protein